MVNKSDLYKTHFTNMMPQRGFLTSTQPFVTCIDIDLTYDTNFILKLFKDEDVTYFFVKNGPIKINPFQTHFSIECENKEDIEYLNSCEIYSSRGQCVFDNDRYSFGNVNHEFQKIEFEKKIIENKIIYKINSKFIEILEKEESLIFSHPNEINPVYGLRILIDNNLSIKQYNLYGYEYILNFIDKQFEKLKLSGKLYKTKHGLRILFNDKFRDISKKENIDSIVDLCEEFLMDKNLIHLYKNKENLKDIKYLIRLTPKLKNYKYFNEKGYDNILENLESMNLESLELEQDIKPLKYDFKTVIYKNNKTNKFINASFSTLKIMIFEYLKNDSFAVCSLIKDYNYAEKNIIIDEFINYHDKWTKANFKNTTLI